MTRAKTNSSEKVGPPAWWGWVLPALVLLSGIVLLEATLHARWLEQVWNVRFWGELWTAEFTRLKVWLDGTALMLGALAAALMLRSPSSVLKFPLALALFALGALSSGLLETRTGPLPKVLEPVLVAFLGTALLPFVKLPRWTRWGFFWLILLEGIYLLSFLPLEGSGLPISLLGSSRLGLLWNELLRPLVRDLGFVAWLLCLLLDLLERSPHLLRSTFARGLIFSGLIMFVTLIYALLVGGVGSLLNAQNNLLLSVAAAALVAAFIQPARQALERGVNRVLYGERDDPYAVTQRLGRQLETFQEPRESLKSALTLMAETLRLPYLGLTLAQGETLEYGFRPEQLERFALVAHSERIGTLEVGRRGRGEVFSSADFALLETLSSQLAAVAHSELLTQQLRDSRERLVRAGEEERKRLRRDLHDGLGPALAGLSLKLEAARMLLERSPEKAAARLTALGAEVQESVSEVRRMVHDLRPPKLDDLGLAGALEDLAGSARGTGLNVQLEGTQDLPRLPAAVEVALYRIAQEALTNVLKHAQAQKIEIYLHLEPLKIVLEVQDDGVGLPQIREPGVGSRSMRERAEALSGSLELQRGDVRGTLVRATFPLELLEG